jgi:hypothetical protein
LREQGVDFSSYAILFWVSAGGRAATVPLLAWMPDAHVAPAVPATEILAARPSDGSIDQPLLADRPDSPLERPPEPSDLPIVPSAAE